MFCMLATQLQQQQSSSNAKMDPLSELELMAANIEEFNDPNTDLAEADLRRWKCLFEMNPNEAEN